MKKDNNNFSQRRSYFYEIIISIITLSVILAIVATIILNQPNSYIINNENMATEALISVTDNAINKIYNIVVILTLYITVIIATYSIFQFSRNKEYEKLKDDINIRLESEVVKLKNENEQIRSEIEKNINEIVNNSRNDVEEIERLNKQLRIELLEVKATNELKANTFYNSQNAIKYYQEISDIIMENPQIIDDERKANLFFQIGYHDYNNNEIDKSEKAYLEALKYSNEKYFCSNVYFNLALLENYRKNIDTALNFFKKSLEINQFNFMNYIEIILLCEKLGKLELAIEYLNDYLRVQDFDKVNKLNNLTLRTNNDNIKNICNNEVLRIQSS